MKDRASDPSAFLPPTLLGGLSPAEFLEEYWQKKPLLIRGALPGFESPLSPEELAGLACEEDVAARLILERGGDYPWQLRYGPLEAEDFADLPESHWSLLVQEVDRLVPEVASLLDAFRFIPNWRLDDVMVSYAPKEGGVGAHVDSYDVFLLQGLGHRRWQIAYEPVEEEVLVPDIDVRILADFEADEDWVLAPGDMLYLPPRIAHHGVALDDCMTYSVGFRAPSRADLLGGFMNHMLEQLDPDERYRDPDLKAQLHPGEIAPSALVRIRRVLHELLSDDDAIDEWFGRYATEPKRGFYLEPPEAPLDTEALREVLQQGAELSRGTPTRFAYFQHPNGEATLFVSGEAYRLDADLAFAAPLLTGVAPLTAETLTPHFENADFMALLTDLVNEGLLEVEQ